MPSYADQDFEKIAKAIGKRPLQVAKFASRFESAALWYRLNCRAPKDIRSADIAKQMRLIANAARRLLRQLEVYDYRNAIDGPGDRKLLHFLACAGNGSESDVIRGTAQIGRLVEIIDGIDAARGLESRGRKAAEDAKHQGRLIKAKGRRGDYALIVWLTEMMSIYKDLTGREPTISVVAGPKGDRPAGPFFRFLQAARKPVECDGRRLSLDGVRERVRALRRPYRQN